MLKTSKYIKDKVLIADGVNTTLDYTKEATGVDLSVKNFYKISSPGILLQKKTIVGDYELIEKHDWMYKGHSFIGWYLPKGTYICALNEGCKFGPKDVGYIVLRSSLNRNGVSLISAVWDPQFTTQNENGVDTMSVRITVGSDQGIYIEENARVGQLMVFEIEEGATQYEGQFQNKGLK